MIKKILLIISLIAIAVLIFVSPSARTYSATGISFLAVAVLTILVLLTGFAVLFITFFLWQTGSFKFSGIPKKAFIAIGGVLVAIALTIFLITGGLSLKEGFPSIIWFIFAGIVLISRALLEVTGMFEKNKGEAWAVTFNMLALGVGLLTFLIFFLQGFGPDNWWQNVLSQKSGKWALCAFVIWMAITYILPGTGTAMTKWTQKVMPLILLGVIVTVVWTAFNPDLKLSLPDLTESAEKEYQTTQAQAAPVPPPSQVIPAPSAPPSNKYELCWDKTPKYEGRNPEVRNMCFDIEMDRIGESLLAKLHFSHQQENQVSMFNGTKIDSETYEGEWHQDNPKEDGKFFFRFTPDGNSASGWVNSGSSGPVPAQLFRKT